MADQQNVSFNPDDASGLIDNVRATIADVKVDYFTANSGEKFVNVDVTYKATDRDFTEHYMLGRGDEWAPNAAKTGAIPLREGGRIWNKSDVFKLIKSLVDAGFPKNRVGTDLSVFKGTDVHLSRVVQEGATYKNKEGKEVTRTTLLVTRIYGLPGEKAGGKAAVASKTAAAPAASATPDTSQDDYAMDVLVRALSDPKAGGSLPLAQIPQAAFILITRDKKAAVRQVVQARLQDEAFLAGLVEQGLIAFDGKTVTLAG